MEETKISEVSPDLKNSGQSGADNAPDAVETPILAKSDVAQEELTGDKARLHQLETLQERESDKDSKVAKSRKREIEALRSKIKSQEETANEKRMEVAKTRVGEAFEYQLRDGSVVRKKAGYIRNNRMINWKRVDEFIQLTKRGEYETAYPIIVANAVAFMQKNPTVTIVDALGNEIPDEELGDYFVYLDGQHRSRALILCKLLNLYDGPIPGVVVKDDVSEVAKYLVSINPSGSWSNNQKAEVLALTATTKYQPLCEAISGLVRKGYNRSTSSQIMTQSKPLTTRQIDNLLAGKEPKDDIVYNVSNGYTFIEACTKAGITVKFLTKRYFIEGFIAFKTQHDLTFAAALEVIAKLPPLTDADLKKVTGKDVFKQMLDNAKQD